MSGNRSLAQRLTWLVGTGFAAIWLLSAFTTALVLRSEVAELYDLEMREMALVLHPAFAGAAGRSPLGSGVMPVEDEMLVWQLVDRTGAVILQSGRAEDVSFPDGVTPNAYSETATHRFFTTPFDAAGTALRVGDSRQERFEVVRESFVAFLLPMLAILPLGVQLIWWISRAALRPLNHLREQIAARGGGRLDPIDAGGQPRELYAITATLNRFILRLAQALDGERAFATNAAHELHTPVTVALAQVQRLRAETRDPEGLARIDAIERALKRMGRLVARLLELARAEAGIGASETAQDLVHLLDLILEDSRRDPARATRLRVTLPPSPVLAWIDPDAFAIAAGNLIENAFRYATPGTPIRIDLSPDAVLTVSNQADPMMPTEVDELTRRFRRARSKTGMGDSGLGLGLHICDTIARQAGGQLVVSAYRNDGGAIFECRMELRPATAPGTPA